MGGRYAYRVWYVTCMTQTPMYYRGAHAAILVFDSTSSDSLDKVAEWVDGMYIGCGKWRA